MSLSANQLVEAISSGVLGKITQRWDVALLANVSAALESSEYYTQNMLTTPNYQGRLPFLSGALSHVQKDGLYLEFGVGNGRTINHIAAEKSDRKIYGFDSFKGLPEDWLPTHPKCTFAQTSLPNLAANCELIIGLFAETLPKFIQDKNQQIAFMHVDCDLYSSAKIVLTNCAPYIGSGTVIAFDEFFNYPGWKQHEYLAWQEFCGDNNVKAKHIGLVSSDTQVAFIIE